MAIFICLFIYSYVKQVLHPRLSPVNDLFNVNSINLKLIERPLLFDVKNLGRGLLTPMKKQSSLPAI